MKLVAHILSSASGLPSVLVSTENSRILFNVGEGVQRYCATHKLRLSKTSRIFLTDLSATSCGGLPGMVLTLADVGLRNISIAGGKGVAQHLYALRHFFSRSDLSIVSLDVGAPVASMPGTPNVFAFTPLAGAAGSKHSANVESLFKAGQPIELEEQAFKHFPQFRPFQYAATAEGVVPISKAELEAPLHGTDEKQEEPADTPVSYVVHTGRVLGKFKPEKAKAFGLAPGPQYGALKSGRSVTLPDGTVIHPHQVKEPDDPGACLVVLRCTDLRQLPALKENYQTLKSQQLGQDVRVVSVVHIASTDVTDSEVYQSTMLSIFGDQVKHLCADPTLVKQHHHLSESLKLTTLLHCVRPDWFILPRSVHSLLQQEVKRLNASSVYAMLKESCTTATTSTEEEKEENKPKRPPLLPITPSWERAFSLDEVHLMPRSQAGVFRAAAKLTAESLLQYVKKEFSRPGIEETVQNISHSLLGTGYKEEEAKSAAPSAPPFRVCFLGTSSAIPTKYRNVTGIWVRYRGGREGGLNAAILLDAGEGTLAQLSEACGSSHASSASPNALYPSLEAALLSLQAVWISHMHADHHLGLISVLEARSRITSQPLLVVGPPALAEWLKESCRFEQRPWRFRFMDAREFLLRRPSSSDSDAGGAPKRQRIEAPGGGTATFTINTCYVDHCYNSFGVRIEFPFEGSLVYSGDCRPTPALTRLGKGCDVLIHEATFESSLHQEAVAKRHSTVDEALKVGAEMGAKNVLLTHFSARYPKLPSLSAEEEKHILHAFDWFDVPPGDAQDVLLFHLVLDSVIGGKEKEDASMA